MAYTNSPLVIYTKLSPNQSGQRNHAIDRITPHCVVGQCSAESLGALFADPARQASSNYGIDKDGRVGMYCPESNRSWCTSNRENDQRAITIECASDTKHPYAMHDAVYAALVELCTDINEVSLDGFQIVPGMMFNRAIDPTMTLWHGSVAFNHICFEAFNDCATIQIRVNTKDRKIAIMPCPSKDKDAISWLKPSQKQKSKKLDCGKFTQPLFQMWDWDKELHYRTVGKVVTSGGKVMILFDFSHPEAWKGLRLVNGIKE